jgi:hypothetical protein
VVKHLSLHIILLSCYELRVTGKSSQSVNMIATQGMSHVVTVTADTNVGLIDTDYQNNCFTVIYV